MWFAKAVFPSGPGYLCVGLLALQVVGAVQRGAGEHETLAVVREERSGDTDDDVLQYVGAWLLDRVEGSEKEDVLKYLGASMMERKAASSFSYGAKRLKMVVKHPRETGLQIYSITPEVKVGFVKRKEEINLQNLILGGVANSGEDKNMGGKITTFVTKKDNTDLLFRTEFSGKVMEWTWKVGPGGGEISVEARFGDQLDKPEAPMIQIYKRDPEVGNYRDWEPTSEVTIIQSGLAKSLSGRLPVEILDGQ